MVVKIFALKIATIFFIYDIWDKWEFNKPEKNYKDDKLKLSSEDQIKFEKRFLKTIKKYPSPTIFKITFFKTTIWIKAARIVLHPSSQFEL